MERSLFPSILRRVRVNGEQFRSHLFRRHFRAVRVSGRNHIRAQGDDTEGTGQIKLIPTLKPPRAGKLGSDEQHRGMIAPRDDQHSWLNGVNRSTRPVRRYANIVTFAHHVNQLTGRFAPEIAARSAHRLNSDQTIKCRQPRPILARTDQSINAPVRAVTSKNFRREKKTIMPEDNRGRFRNSIQLGSRFRVHFETERSSPNPHQQREQPKQPPAPSAHLIDRCWVVRLQASFMRGT